MGDFQLALHHDDLAGAGSACAHLLVRLSLVAHFSDLTVPFADDVSGVSPFPRGYSDYPTNPNLSGSASVEMAELALCDTAVRTGCVVLSTQVDWQGSPTGIFRGQN